MTRSLFLASKRSYSHPGSKCEPNDIIQPLPANFVVPHYSKVGLKCNFLGGPATAWGGAPSFGITPTPHSYFYLCQHPYLLLFRCSLMSSMIVYRVVVCVNPWQRRRWCRDGIPDPGNAAQIPSLPTAISLCSALAVLQECQWIAGSVQSQVQCSGCRCMRQEQCFTCSPWLNSPFATKQIPQQSVSVNKLPSLVSSFQSLLINIGYTNCCSTLLGLAHPNVNCIVGRLFLHLASQLNSSIKVCHQ